MPRKTKRPRAGGRTPARAFALAPSPVLEFMRLLWAVDHGLHRVSRRMERTHGVTGPQRLALRMLGRHPGVSSGALAELLHVHPSTITEVVRRLERAGLVERRTDPVDARRAVLRLTARGRAVNALRQGTAEARVAAALDAVTQEEIASASRVLSELARRLDGDG